jgi:membrane fusion protein (multidrug efflux system)
MMPYSRSKTSCQRLALFVLAAAMLAGCERRSAEPMAPPPPEVTVVQAQAGPVPLELMYSGRAVGSREVEVRARVSGILLERSYEEGSAVRQGEVLFRIDPEPFRVSVAQARAELEVERARLAEARRDRDRVRTLIDRQLVSQRQWDEAVSRYEVASASVAAADARLRAAELDLSYTEVRAPISGLTSREARSEGSLVTAGEDSSLLTRIVQSDPIYAEFAVPESEAALLRARLAAGGEVPVHLAGEGAAEGVGAARLTFVDNAVGMGSGTVRARAVMANPDGRFVPGQFLRIRVEGITLPGGVSVPERAVMSGPQGRFVWVLDGQDVAAMRPVQIAAVVSDRAVLSGGLEPGERVVVEGVLKVRPGAPVAIAPADPAVPGDAPAPAEATQDAG